MKMLRLSSWCCVIALSLGCSVKKASDTSPLSQPQPAASYFKVDPATAGAITGTVRYLGKRSAPLTIDMSEDPACVQAHHGRAHDESLLVSPRGGLGNSFVYISKGLEGKTFEVPATPVIMDQSGCWFRPRILGLQTNQVLQVINSDPVTHNIHPMAQTNREWNHSQGPGDAPINRKFPKPEIMIPVKCNIHSWMHAYIGVVDHPYFTVTKDDGSFAIRNLPPGTYTLTTWQEKLGTQSQQVTVAPQKDAVANVTYKGK